MTDMKKILQIFIKILCFGALLFLALYLSCIVVENKSGYERYSGFFEEAGEDHLDMLFFGTSHVINGINPIQIYSETGFTSYNMGAYGSPMQATFWQMMLALEKCNPKLIVVDSYMLEYDIRYQDDENANTTLDMQHFALDVYPISPMKVRACRDLFQSKDIQREFLFNFITYHDRWKELQENDFLRVVNKMPCNELMGADPKYELHADPYVFNLNPDWTDLPSETVGTQYLRRMILECEKRGINIMVMSLPYNAQEMGQRANYTAKKICEEYSVPYCDMLTLTDLTDVNIDLSDSGHLNILGMTKASSYFAKWLSDSGVAEEVGLLDHRGDPGYEKWDKANEEYIDDVKHQAIDQKDLYAQLMMLSMSDEQYIIKINGSTEVYYDKTLMRLIKNLYPESRIDEAASLDQPYFLIKTGETVDDYVGFGDPQTWSVEVGELEYSPIVDNFQILTVNGDTDNNYLYDDEHAYADIRIIFMGDPQDPIKKQVYYTCDHFEYTYDR